MKYIISIAGLASVVGGAYLDANGIYSNAFIIFYSGIGLMILGIILDYEKYVFFITNSRNRNVDPYDAIMFLINNMGRMVVFFFLLFSFMVLAFSYTYRSSGAYQKLMDTIDVGEDYTDGVIILGSMSQTLSDSINKGSAAFQFAVYGEKSNYLIDASLIKKKGEWILQDNSPQIKKVE